MNLQVYLNHSVREVSGLSINHPVTPYTAVRGTSLKALPPFTSEPPLPKHPFCINLSLLCGFPRRSPVTPNCQQKPLATDIPTILRQNDLSCSPLILDPNHLKPLRNSFPMLNMKTRIVRLEWNSGAALPGCEFFVLPFNVCE